jgi:hypothetical protein
VDPHEGYRSAVVNPDPATGASSPLADVTIVVDPFHVVRLANQAVTRCRQRVQQEAMGHRGWKGDPLYDVRKLLLMGAERVDDAGWARINAALDAGDPTDEVRDCWTAKEKVRDVYLTNDVDQAGERLDDAIAWCAAAGVRARAPHPRQDAAAVANSDPGPSHHRRVERPGRGRQPPHQAGETLRPRPA